MKFLNLCLLIVASTSQVRADEVIQLNVSDAFNARPVSTVVGGKLVPMRDDVDGAGGVATQSAAATYGSADPHALPDDGKFPANAAHPEIVLPFAADDGKKNLARRCAGGDAFVLTVPAKRYAKLIFFFTSGQGVSQIEIKLKYADGAIENHAVTVPDWYWLLKPEEQDWCYVATDLSKWGPAKQLEKNHHSIFGLTIRPGAAKAVKAILISKSDPGIMVFFGATGQVSGP